jgi:hypothetical protein
MSNHKLNLHRVLKLSYDNNNNHQQKMKKNGYQFDSMLSTKNEKVYFNPTANKLLVSVAGTDKFSPNDLITDVYLAAGSLQNTSRYKQARNTITDAKKKYQVSSATLAGHSLGGSIVSYAGSKADTIYTLDKGATIGTKTRSREKAFRSAGDVVSALSSNSGNMKTLGKYNANPLAAHNISNIKQNKIYI